MSSMVHVFFKPLQKSIQGIFLAGSDDAPIGDLVVGSFSQAFSSDFDIYLPEGQQFSSAFSSDFTNVNLGRMHAFSSAFGTDYAI